MGCAGGAGDSVVGADKHLRRRSEVQRVVASRRQRSGFGDVALALHAFKLAGEAPSGVLVHRIWGLVAETASRVRSGSAVGASCIRSGAIPWQKRFLVRTAGPRLATQAAPRGAARTHTRGRFCHQPSQSVSHSPQMRRRSAHRMAPAVNEERNRDSWLEDNAPGRARGRRSNTFARRPTPAADSQQIGVPLQPKALRVILPSTAPPALTAAYLAMIESLRRERPTCSPRSPSNSASCL